MKGTVKEILKIAEKCVGIRENSEEFKMVIDTYNNQKTLPRGYKVSYKDPWCAVFISFISILSGCENIILPECSAQYLYNGIKGKSVSNVDIQAGDIVIYNWKKNPYWADHIGIVQYVGGSGNVYIIEGNSSNGVQRKQYSRLSEYIIGIKRPHYLLEREDITVVAMAVIRGEYGNGSVRKGLLISAGYDADAVQKRVNEILSCGK